MTNNNPQRPNEQDRPDQQQEKKPGQAQPSREDYSKEKQQR